MSNVIVTPQTKLGLVPNFSSGTVKRVKYARARENLHPLGEARRRRKKETVLEGWVITRARVFRSLYYHLGYVHSAPFEFTTA